MIKKLSNGKYCLFSFIELAESSMKSIFLNFIDLKNGERIIFEEPVKCGDRYSGKDVIIYPAVVCKE